MNDLPNISENGIVPFPEITKRADIIQVRDVLLKKIFDHVHQYNIEKNRSSEIIYLTLPILATEILRIFLYKDLKTSHIVEVHKNDGFKKELQLKKIYRNIRNVYTNHFKYRQMRTISDSEILTFSLSNFISKYAKDTRTNLVYSRFDDWMTPIEDVYVYKIDDHVIKEATDYIFVFAEELFKIFSKEFLDYEVQYLKVICQYFLPRVLHYLEEIESNYKYLPKTFWSGTCGIIYNRIFARVIDKIGGDTYAFDHGTGVALSRQVVHQVVEFNYTKYFFAFAKIQNEDEIFISEFEFKGKDRTQILYPDIKDKKKGQLTKVCEKKIESLTYITTVYSSRGVLIDPLLDSLCVFDFHARILSRLKNNRIDVTYRPHPESVLGTPEYFRKISRISEGSFTKLMDDSTSFIFDYVNSTTFFTVLSQKRLCPIIILELPWVIINETAKRKLKNRCALVSVQSDSAGRLQYNEDELAEALAIAPTLVNDDTFIDDYLPYYM